MTTLRAQYMESEYGRPNRAAASLARDLMRGDPATFRRGYARENAILAALETFPEADRAVVEHLVPR